MDIQLEKYKLMEWLIGLKDERIISMVIEIKSENENLWSDDISEIEKLFIRAGMTDLKDGEIFSHEQVLEEISKSYGL